MADPLKLLQEYVIEGREIQEIMHNGALYFVFGDVAYPHDAKTNLAIYNKTDEYYSIESVLYLWRNQEMVHTAYVKEVSGKGIQPITRVQRKELIEYLKGERTAPPKDANMLAPAPAPIHYSRLIAEKSAVKVGSSSSSASEPERKRPKLDEERKGQRIDRILDQSIDRTDVVDLRSLSSDLPAEKVAQLRTLVKKNLKSKPIEEDSYVFDSHLAIPDASSDSVGKQLQAKERVRKNRLTCLEAPSRDFSGVLAVLNDFRIRESGQQKGADASLTKPASTSVFVQSSSSRQSTVLGSATVGRRTSGPNGPVAGGVLAPGYSRYDQEIFQREQQPMIAEFEIKTDLSFHGASIGQIKTVNVSASSSTSVTTARAIGGPSGSTTATSGVGGRISGGTLPNSGSAGPTSGGPGPSRMVSANSTGGPTGGTSKRQSRTPIIIIPATGTALITMYNAVDILQDLRFISTEDKKAKGVGRENELLLQIRKNGATVPYRVVDNPLKLTDEEWDRVVAVFVQGPAWQFKGWKLGGGNPVDIFAHVAAFHLKFDEQKLDPNVAKWSVNLLQISRLKRHLDRAILHKFWDILNRYIAKNKHWLRY